MATPATANRPTPERIFNALNAYQQTAALRSAIELDVFSAIGAGANTSATLAANTGAAEKGVRVLCDYLTVQGFLGTERARSIFDSLTETVRNGGSVWEEGGDNTKPNDEFWVAFAKSMAPLTVTSAEFISGLLRAEEGKPMKVLDIAAGHGMYGIS